MKTKTLFLLMLSAPLIFSGCATRALWEETSTGPKNEPADDVKLALFDAPGHTDVLVVYQEYSERHDSVHTRSYWLLKNQIRIQQRHVPQFVNFPYALYLTPIPVFAATNAPLPDANPPATYAVVSTNFPSFVLYSSDQTSEEYMLPVYIDGSRQAKRIALTPLTVAADITIVGGLIVIWGAEAAAQSQHGSPVYYTR